MASLRAICVLGCPSGSPALARRARAAAERFHDEPALVVACGGLAWHGRIESDEIADRMTADGVPAETIVRDRLSRDTWENAVRARVILHERAIDDVVLVTCSWHLPRARLLFERAGLNVVEAVGVAPPAPTLGQRVWWAARERAARVKDRFRRMEG